MFSSWCKYCGCGLDKRPVKTGNCCTLCERKRNIIRCDNYRKNAKTKRPSRSNTKRLPSK